MKLTVTITSMAVVTASLIVHAASPYAPTSITGDSIDERTYAYNTMGQRLGYEQSAGPSQTIEWGLEGKLTKITTEQGVESIAHGFDGKRYMRVFADNSKRFYVGDREFRMDLNDPSKSGRFVYIRAGDYSPVALVKANGTTPEYSYFLRDHLGSNLATVNESGELNQNTSQGRYDPWGQPWQADGVESEMLEDSRAFTGHENIASADLIHMNGRVFDPLLGSFLGPDKYIKDSTMPGINGYAYVQNNPLSATDPSGWIPETRLSEVFRGARERAFEFRRMSPVQRADEIARQQHQQVMEQVMGQAISNLQKAKSLSDAIGPILEIQAERAVERGTNEARNAKIGFKEIKLERKKMEKLKLIKAIKSSINPSEQKGVNPRNVLIEFEPQAFRQLEARGDLDASSSEHGLAGSVRLNPPPVPLSLAHDPNNDSALSVHIPIEVVDDSVETNSQLSTPRKRNPRSSN